MSAALAAVLLGVLAGGWLEILAEARWHWLLTPLLALPLLPPPLALSAPGWYFLAAGFCHVAFCLLRVPRFND